MLLPRQRERHDLARCPSALRVAGASLQNMANDGKKMSKPPFTPISKEGTLDIPFPPAGLLRTGQKCDAYRWNLYTVGAWKSARQPEAAVHHW